MKADIKYKSISSMEHLIYKTKFFVNYIFIDILCVKEYLF